MTTDRPWKERWHCRLRRTKNLFWREPDPRARGKEATPDVQHEDFLFGFTQLVTFYEDDVWPFLWRFDNFRCALPCLFNLCEFVYCSITIFLVYLIDNVIRIQYMNCAEQCTQCTGLKVGIGRVMSRRPSSWSRWVSCPACVQMAHLSRATFHHLVHTPTFHLYTVSMSTAKNIKIVEGKVICCRERIKPVPGRVWPMANDQELSPAVQHEILHILNSFGNFPWKRHALPFKISCTFFVCLSRQSLLAIKRELALSYVIAYFFANWSCTQ